MKNSYEEMIKLLKKNEEVPEQIFNKVIFSIQNNHANKQSKRTTNILVALSPFVTSVIVFVMFIGINSFNIKNKAEKDFLLQIYDQSYANKYILDIKEDFLF